MLAMRAGEIGAIPLVSDVQPDDPDAITAEVLRAALAADLVLVIAGSSVGRSDYTGAVLTEIGDLTVSGVAVRPGHPALLGYAVQRRLGGLGPALPVPVIGIPGYPLAAAVIFELFAARLLARLLGWDAQERPWQRARLACDWNSSPDIEDWVSVTLTPVPAGPDGDCAVLATPRRRGAGAISQFVRADGGRFRSGNRASPLARTSASTRYPVRRSARSGCCDDFVEHVEYCPHDGRRLVA